MTMSPVEITIKQTVVEASNDLVWAIRTESEGQEQWDEGRVAVDLNSLLEPLELRSGCLPDLLRCRCQNRCLTV